MFWNSQCCMCITGGHTIFVDKELSVCVMQRDMCPVASVWQKVDHRLLAEELECEGTFSTIIAVHFGMHSGSEIDHFSSKCDCVCQFSSSACVLWFPVRLCALVSPHVVAGP